MEDIAFSALIVLVGLAVHQGVSRGRESGERLLLTIGFFAHVVAGVAQVLVYRYYYAGGDILAYQFFGVPIAEAMRSDFASIFPETVKVFFHSNDAHLPYPIIGFGSTGTMSMVAVWLLFLFGDSLYAASLAIAVPSFFSKVLIYHALREDFAPGHRRMVLAAVVLVPTAVFWTSTLLKEPVMMVFFGPVCFAVRLIVSGRRMLLAAAVLGVCGTVVALLKAYVLMSVAGAAMLWIVWARVLKSRGSVAVKPIYLGLAIVMGMFGVTFADNFLRKSSSGGWVESMAYQRRVSANEAGGSNFYLEDPNTEVDAPISLASQLALTPIALVTALFRPFVFEARNVMQFLNSLETAWLLWLFVRVIRRNGAAGTVARVTASPVLMFCLAFTVALAIGTGLSTANLGALSRYRAPMIPFFVVLLLSLSRAESAAAATEPRARQAIHGAA
jgi:hypothetical protein